MKFLTYFYIFISTQLVSTLTYIRRQYRDHKYIDHNFDSSEEVITIVKPRTKPPVSRPPPRENIEIECQSYLEKAADSQYEPACGSDNKTYSNKLYMSYQNCLDQSKGLPTVNLQYVGECSNKEESVKCVSFIDQGKPVFQPVCGSDRNTYVSIDDLNFQNCLSKEKGEPAGVTVLYPGECKLPVEKDPIPEMNCNVLLDKANMSRPDPVCGSNGKTYPNAEEVEYENCMSQQKVLQKISVIHNGACYDRNPAQKKDCTILIDKAKTSRKNPACASNGRTYNNKEEIDYENCIFQQRGLQEIYVQYNGACYNPSVVDDRPGCLDLIDKTKMNENKPVCGTDRKTYINKEYMLLTTCLSQIKGEQPVGVQHEGECYSSCPTSYNIPSNVVCGSDGETYNTIEAMERRNCLKNLNGRNRIKLAYQGICIELSYKGMVWV